MTIEARAARSIRLRELLDLPDVRDALASVEGDLIDGWRACHDSVQRETLWHTLHAFGLLRSRLMNWSQSDISALARKR